ncbi:uncharacterized protein LOC113333875 [Papaver somniferum]|uniref:uncharacterized protein LOC113333875 n=1 Tax=Papaver somniferum TaxID=3469 RepID=UPI000E6FE840|nr:uncharacterized protein LOC113333875 [Papaver somniferum]
MRKLFLEKYFPASKAASVRKEISGILQFTGESLYEYWDRYKKLVASFPHHNISPTLIIQYFYEGLLTEQRNLIDVAAGGSLTEKIISQATSLIDSMASNAQQFYTRQDSNVRRVSNMEETSQSEQRMKNMEKVIQRMTTVIIPSYEEDAEVNVIFPNQRPSYTNKQAAASNPYVRQGGFQQFQQPQQVKERDSSSDDKINALMQGMQGITSMLQQSQQNQQKNDATIKELRNQVGQLETDMNIMKSQASTQLPSQPFVNPREHVNTITLRSGR